ncbi:MAG: alpha/beta hydrolase [Pseudobdellovibrio sp.]
METTKLDGVSGVINAQLFTQHQESKKLALVFPGAGYSYREPLLRFGIQVLLKKGYQVLALDKIYGDDPNWRGLKSEQEARKVVEDDTVKIFEQIKTRFSKEPDLLFGRSLGTYAIACLLNRNLAHPKQIVWQTPALGSHWGMMCECKIPGFGILGTADHYYSQAIEHLPKDRIVIDGADHGMEISGDPIQSIEILKKVTQTIFDWIN